MKEMRRLLLILSFFAFVATSPQAQVRIQFRSGEEPIPNLGALHNPPPHTSPLFESFFEKMDEPTKKIPS